MVKVQQVKGRFFCSIPMDKAIRMQLRKGDILDVNFNERGNLEMSKITDLLGVSNKRKRVLP